MPPAIGSKSQVNIPTFSFAISTLDHVVRSILKKIGAGMLYMPKKVIIAGFGDAGKLVFSEIGKDNRKEYVVLCFLDDDPAKLGQEHFGAKVLGRIRSEEHTSELQSHVN